MNDSNIPSFSFIKDIKAGENDFFSEAFENRPIKVALVAISLTFSIFLVSFYFYMDTLKKLNCFK